MPPRGCELFGGRSKYSEHTPYMITCVASVAMNGCMLYFATKKPFRAPKSPHAKTAMIIGINTGSSGILGKNRFA